MSPEVRNWFTRWQLKGGQPLVWLDQLDAVPEEVFDRLQNYLLVRCGDRVVGIRRLPTTVLGSRQYLILGGGGPGTGSALRWVDVKKRIRWALME